MKASVPQGATPKRRPSSLLVADDTQTWMAKPNFPSTDDAPTVPRPILSGGPDLAAGAVSIAHYDFLPAGNTNTRALLDQRFYYNYANGNQTTVTGDDGIDTPGVGQSYSRARHYRAGSTYDLHSFDAEGLNLNAFCSLNNTPAGCTQNNIVGGIIRSPIFVVPGMIISARLRFPRGPTAWNSFWIFTGVQYTPGPGGNPYAGFGTRAQLIFGENAPNTYHEFDIIDKFNHENPGVLPTHYLNTGFAKGNDSSYSVQPHNIYSAGGPAFSYFSNNGFPFQATAPAGVDLAAGFHTFTMEWAGDGSNKVRVYLDRQLYLEQYWEYTKSTYIDPRSGATRLLGSHVLLTSSPVPTFLSSSSKAHIVPNDGIAKGWTLTVQSLDIVRGSVANPMSYATDINATPGR